MIRPAPIVAFALVALPMLLGGCGAKTALPAGSPVMRSAPAAMGAKAVTHPSLPLGGNTFTTPAHSAFLTQMGAGSPTFSPRGDRLAFTTPSRGVLIASPNASNARQLTGSLPGDHDPCWSPTGDAIAVVRAGANGGSTLAKIMVATGQTSTIIQGAAALHQPTWMPDGQSLVYVQDQASSSALMRVSVGGGAPAPIWQGPLAASPAVSPDGRSLVFEMRGLTGQSGLGHLTLPAGPVGVLTVAGANPRYPSFSASGRSLAYIADDGLYVANADGTQSRRVASGGNFDEPSWNPLAADLVVAATQGSRSDLEQVALPAR